MVSFVRFLGGPLDGRTIRRADIENDGSLPAQWFVPMPMLGEVLSGQVSLLDESLEFGLAKYGLSPVADGDGTPLYRFEEKP